MRSDKGKKAERKVRRAYDLRGVHVYDSMTRS
jgi:hypothetical protein